MKIAIPSQQNPILKQVNDSSLLGNIGASFNLDLTSDSGKIKATKTLQVKKATTLTTTDFGGILGFPSHGFATISNTIHTLSGQRVWVGGNAPSDGFVLDTGTGVPTLSNNSDIKTYSGTLWVSNGGNLFNSLGINTPWTSRYTYPSNGSPLLEVHRGQLYFTFDNYKIGRINAAYTVNTTVSPGFIDFALPGYIISFLKSDGDNLWVGMVNSSGGNSEKTYIYRWDGTSSTWQYQFGIDSRSILAGCLVDRVPYVVDGNGRLLQFTGVSFKEINRFPLPQGETLFASYSSNDQRGIHKNGMCYDPLNKELLINISNQSQTGDTNHPFPSGVWAYTEQTGLFHKYSPANQDIANSGTTGLYNYGEYNYGLPGAVTTINLTKLTGEKGRVLFGASVMPIGTVSVDYGLVGVWTDDTANTSQKFSYLITQEIHSGSIIETWQKVYAMYKKLLNSADKIIVKYRTNREAPTVATMTWQDIDTVTTTTDVSSYLQGDEIEFVQGSGSGRSFHIKSITNNAGTYTIKLDDQMISTVIGLTANANFSKWIKLGEATYATSDTYKEFVTTEKNISSMFQLKVAMQFTGDDELYGLFITSSSLIKE